MGNTNLITIASNLIIISLINYEPNYPWYRYLYNSISQIEDTLPVLLKGYTDIDLLINTDDETLEFSLIDPNPETEPNLKIDISPISISVYFD